MSSRVAIIAALPREIRSLVGGWRVERVADGVTVYSSERAIAVVAGMGASRARMAAETALAGGPVHLMVSAGWAGGLHPEMRSGEVYRISKVRETVSGKTFVTTDAEYEGMILVTVDRVASAEGKRRLHEEYTADLVDMEAAAVAQVAQARGVPFSAIKAVSDEYDFDLPGLDHFSTPEGRFREGAFAAYVALRPALWKSVRRMARSSAVAAENLCAEIERQIERDQKQARR